MFKYKCILVLILFCSFNMYSQTDTGLTYKSFAYVSAQKGGNIQIIDNISKSFYGSIGIISANTNWRNSSKTLGISNDGQFLFQDSYGLTTTTQIISTVTNTVVSGINFSYGGGMISSPDGNTIYAAPAYNIYKYNILKTTSTDTKMILEHSVDWNRNNAFGIVSTNNKMQITDHNQNYNVYNSVASINDNNWHLLSTTVDRSLGANDQSLIYIDGNAPNSVNVPGLNNNNNGNFTSHKLYISSRAGSNYFFNGNIAQVLIYKRVLTAEEIQQSFNTVKLKYGL